MYKQLMKTRLFTTKGCAKLFGSPANFRDAINIEDDFIITSSSERTHSFPSELRHFTNNVDHSLLEEFDLNIYISGEINYVFKN